MMASPSDPSRPFVPLIERAVELAAEWHDRTYRKGRWRPTLFETPEDEPPVRVPAMAHVTSVATTVLRAGWEKEVVAAAFLHDALEDPNAYGESLAIETMQEAVGQDVVELVAAVTERKRDEAGNERSWRARKDDYIQHLSEVPTAAVAISLADKLHNLWTINQSLERGVDPFVSTASRQGLSAGPEAQAWFHRAVFEASTQHKDVRLEPLRRQLQEELERFEQLIAQRQLQDQEEDDAGID